MVYYDWHMHAVSTTTEVIRATEEYYGALVRNPNFGSRWQFSIFCIFSIFSLLISACHHSVACLWWHTLKMSSIAGLGITSILSYWLGPVYGERGNAVGWSSIGDEYFLGLMRGTRGLHRIASSYTKISTRAIRLHQFWSDSLRAL